MQNILFVCTGNSCRSVMAEGLFKKAVAKRADEFLVSSAGISAFDGYPPTGETIRAMQEEDEIDVSDYRSRRLTVKMVEAADKILVMEQFHKDMILELCPDAQSRVFLLKEFSADPKQNLSDLDIPDPIRMSDYFYRNVLSVIRDCVNQLASTL